MTALRPNFVKYATEIFRAYIVTSLPSSGAQKPVKVDIRTWGGLIEAALTDLYNKAPTPLGAVGGTANAVTATGTPGVPSLAAGQFYSIVPTITNTDTITLLVDTNTAKAVLDRNGRALIAGRWKAGERHVLYYDGTQFVLVSMQPLERSAFAGLVPSNNAGTPLTKIDVSVGLCRSSDDTADLGLNAVMTKSLASTWVAGTGNGGLDTGALAVSTSYDVYIIGKADGTATDIIACKTSLGFSFPTGYSLKRLIGQFMTDGSSNIRAGTWFTDGRFLYTVPVNDINATNPGTAAVLRTLSAPIGAKAKFVMSVANVTTAAIQTLITETTQTDTAPSTTLFSLRVGAVNVMAAVELERKLDASGQVRSRLSASGAADVLIMTTFGWWSDRGIHS